MKKKKKVIGGHLLPNKQGRHQKVKNNTSVIFTNVGQVVSVILPTMGKSQFSLRSFQLEQATTVFLSDFGHFN